jgi:hypothetical protein
MPIPTKNAVILFDANVLRFHQANSPARYDLVGEWVG